MSKKHNTLPGNEDTNFNEIVLEKIAILLKVLESVNFKRNRCIDNINLIMSSHKTHTDVYDKLEDLFSSLSIHENTLKTITYYIEQMEKQLKK